MRQHAAAATVETDGDLLTRMNAGDPASLETLYDRYAPYVHGLALRILASRELADEVTQDVFWLLWKRKMEYDPERGRFSTWLFAVTRNRSIDRIRTERRRPSTTAIDDDMHSVSKESPEENVYLAERRQIVLEALSQLPSDQRKAVELCFYGGMSHREVATRLGEPLGTVKSRIRMGIEKLKQSLLDPGEHLR